MPRNVSPEVRRRMLAAGLRQLRENSGLKTSEVARHLSWSPAKVSRYELARTGLKPSDVRQMLVFYAVDAQRQSELLALAEEASEKGWWEEFSDVLPEGHISLIGLEDEATDEWSWHLEVIPGLLQTKEYAIQVNSKGYSLAPVPPSRIDRSVTVRMKRQERLTQEPALKLAAVLDEAVLRRRIGDKHVMRTQLLHLIAVAQLPNICMRIIKLSDESPMVMNSFDMLRFGDQGATMPDIVYTEHFRGTLHFEDETDTHQYQIVFKRLQEAALSERESLDFIDQILHQVWT